MLTLPRLRRILLTLLVATAASAGLFALGAPASASPVPASTGAMTAHDPLSVTTAIQVPDEGGGYDTDTPSDYALSMLPIERWAGATSEYHIRQNTDLLSTDIFKEFHRNVLAGGVMSLADLIWSATSGLTRSALSLSLFDMIGAPIDEMAGRIGSALLGGPDTPSVVLMLLVAALLYALWQGRKQGAGAAWRVIGPKLVVVALMGAMVFGATNSSGDNDGYEPGFFSPGWILTSTEEVVSTLASVPAAAISQPIDSISQGASGHGPYHCDTYVEHLRDRYKSSAGGTVEGGWAVNSAAVTPLIMSGMWENTSLEVWKRAQFGSENPWADRVYCRLLETNAGMSPSLVAWQSRQVGAENAQTLAAPFTWVDNRDRDVAMVAWASCDGPEPVTDRLENPSQADKANSPGCEEWWTGVTAHLHDGDETDLGSVDLNHSVHDWEPDTQHIIENLSGDRQALDFVMSLQGHKGAGAVGTAAFASLIAAICVFVVFGLMSLAVLGAKVMLLGVMLVMLILLTVSLLPKTNTAEKLMAYFRQILGYMVLAAGAVFLFSLVAVLAELIQTIGSEMFGQGSMMGILWTGMSPLLAAFVFHMIFKKVLKAPSPFSPKSAVAYGAAAGGIGAAVGAGGAGWLSRRMSGAGRMAKGATFAAGKGLANRYMPASMRKGAMQPGGAAADKAQRTTTAAEDRDKQVAEKAATGGQLSRHERAQALRSGASTDKAGGDITSAPMPDEGREVAGSADEERPSVESGETEGPVEKGTGVRAAIGEAKQGRATLRREAAQIRAANNPSGYRAELMRRTNGGTGSARGHRWDAAKAAGSQWAKDSATLAKHSIKQPNRMRRAVGGAAKLTAKTAAMAGKFGLKATGKAAKYGVTALALGPAGVPVAAAMMARDVHRSRLGQAVNPWARARADRNLIAETHQRQEEIAAEQQQRQAQASQQEQSQQAGNALSQMLTDFGYLGSPDRPQVEADGDDAQVGGDHGSPGGDNGNQGDQGGAPGGPGGSGPRGNPPGRGPAGGSPSLVHHQPNAGSTAADAATHRSGQPHENQGATMQPEEQVDPHPAGASSAPTASSLPDNLDDTATQDAGLHASSGPATSQPQLQAQQPAGNQSPPQARTPNRAGQANERRQAMAQHMIRQLEEQRSVATREVKRAGTPAEAERARSKVAELDGKLRGMYRAAGIEPPGGSAAHTEERGGSS